MTKSPQNNKTKWEEISDSYAQTTPETIGPVLHPHREITMDDLNDIFAGRPLVDSPREKATVMRKTYLTETLDKSVRQQAKRENLGISAFIRKAIATYLNGTRSTGIQTA
ncbi:hypothetical protein OZX67_00315 [Bifidobacterium sp. ESL0728]|uniref:hypothetical protein n=1 Tax=Bifidobacterium sp. ESL0728 TaxID=2983220 RepID=UPI0023FA43A3|nr:hypothetical protein [Bifidobacterium sp. ESL0728]WEV59064.1 hypothetical protein OZX67_00315 [Bifidobacterium sp. ESL0728]